MTDDEQDNYDEGYDEGYESALKREGIEPDRALMRYIAHRLELTGAFWEGTLGAAMTGDPACAAHVLAHCEKHHKKWDESVTGPTEHLKGGDYFNHMADVATRRMTEGATCITLKLGTMVAMCRFIADSMHQQTQGEPE